MNNVSHVTSGQTLLPQVGQRKRKESKSGALQIHLCGEQADKNGRVFFKTFPLI